MIRITADLDNINMLTAAVRVKAIVDILLSRYKWKMTNAKIRLSASGKGCHVIMWTPNKIAKKDIIFIRELLGDDHRRIAIDKKRKNARQYLFKKKKKISNNKLIDIANKKGDGLPPIINGR